MRGSHTHNMNYPGFQPRFSQLQAQRYISELSHYPAWSHAEWDVL